MIKSLQQKLILAMAAFVALTGLLIAGSSYLISARQQQNDAETQIRSVGTILGVHVGNWLGAKATVLNAFRPIPHDATLPANMSYARDAGGFANVFVAYPDGTQENANKVVLPPDNNDPRKWHWWSRAQQQPSATFVEMPSVAAATHSAVSSFAHAVLIDGSDKLVAVFPVVGTEFSLVTVSDSATLLAPQRALL